MLGGSARTEHPDWGGVLGRHQNPTDAVRLFERGSAGGVGACSKELLVEIAVPFDAVAGGRCRGQRGRPECLEHPAWAFSVSLPHVCRRP